MYKNYIIIMFEEFFEVFKYSFRGKKQGCTKCLCIGTHTQHFRKNSSMDIYDT